jgi:hypothetical protein
MGRARILIVEDDWTSAEPTMPLSDFKSSIVP